MRPGLLALGAALALLVATNESGWAQTVPPPALDPKLCTVPASPAADLAVDRQAKRKARTELDNARQAYLKGDFSTAILSLQAAYGLEPGVDLLYNIAQSCREAGLEREALPIYEEVLKHNPTPEQKEASEAKIKELRPKAAEMENAQAIRALDDKRYGEATAGFARAFALHPQPAYLFRLGEAQRLAGKNTAAMATYERLLKEAPSSLNAGDAQRQLSALKAQQADEEATARYDQGEFVRAALAWDAAYKEEPRSIFLFRKAEAMRQTGQRNEAAAEYERYLRESTTAERPELRQQAERWAKELRQAPKPQESAPKPIYKRWWFWVAIGGAVVAATVVGVGVGRATQANPSPPMVPPGVTVYQPGF